MIRGATEVRDAYRDQEVAAAYVRQRFLEPLGALLHDRQVAYMTRLFESTKPSRVLEIAPGPARLTKELVAVLTNGPTLLDASAEMLSEAKARLEVAAGRCRFVQGDVFALPLRGSFDVVYTFRLIRHFERHDRLRIYKAVAHLLATDGLLVFDAVNAAESDPMRRRSPEQYQHYDALLTRDEITQELREAGLSVVSLLGVQRRFSVLSRLQVLVAPRSRPLARAAMEAVDRFSGGQPLEWIVTCCRA